MASLENFPRNGTSESLQVASWLQMKAHAQADVLVLPRPPAKKKKCTTATVTGKLLARELLQQIDEGLNAKKKAEANSKKSSIESR
ncbi:hypothetical protein GN244_ATG08979 [Phytophthora infestans]|uniref:Uncharacterized protein n=1 Tax=Phytophthora infestans TaxID=4787 RepID=A0A833W1W7_PHYIN|nr:hypothetical protein GN244_ATG08979 [Phytophthora infestans]KAF4135164.1 hypothetical protein GN958_ATG15658 [Phytophthora infestans]KAF4142076.1 hypothetical protein GN958_ATG08776 [Phytophthora infestans]